MGWTASSGCGLDCGNPSLSNGHYAIFANVLEYEGTNLENFPSARTPANGWSEWSIEWSPEQVGVVTVGIDGQEYEAQGAWHEVECGRFTLAFSGVFLSAVDSTHEFQANGDFVTYANQLEGRWDWTEQWGTAGGASGEFLADGQVSGSLISEVE